MRERGVRVVSEGANRLEPSALPRDLVPRAISGFILAVVALAGNWAGPGPFALLVMMISVIMAWEWQRIIRGGSIDGIMLLHAGVVAAAVGITAFGRPHWATALVLVGAVVMLVVSPRSRAQLSALGVVYVGLPAIALVWLRSADAHGAAAILFIFIIVWTTDTFAYICGRLIGGPKLWPAMSPRKTWSGTVGGIAFAALAGAMFAALLPRSAPMMLALAAVGLSIVAQIGDLAESALKRAFDVKNASELIPGHGGFMDRMDGVVTAAALAALFAVVRGPATPAQSLLFWS